MWKSAAQSPRFTTRSEMTHSAMALPTPKPKSAAKTSKIHFPLTFALVRQLAAAKPAHNPATVPNTRLGRESSRSAWHEGHCKFSVRTNSRVRGTFPKHNGQARFHMVVNFVRCGLKPLNPLSRSASSAISFDMVSPKLSRRILTAPTANRTKHRPLRSSKPVVSA